MSVDPVLALLTVAVVANLVLMGALIVPALLGRRGALPDDEATGDRLAGAVRLAAVDGRPEPGLLDAGVPQGAYDRIVRIVAWVSLLAITAIVAVSGLWPDTQVAILVLLASAGLFIVVVHDLLPPKALGSAKFVVEGSVGITFAALLVLLTGQEASPFFFTFPLIVAGAALVVSPGVTIALAAAASFGYLAAVLLPVDEVPLSPMSVATIGINLTALLLLTYVAMVIAREQRRSHDRAIHLSTVDALTGLFNRSFLFAAVDREIARSSRSGRGFCVLMMDLDGLKAVNDRFGHHVGDRLLRSVGDEIRTGVRRIDTPARYGGDEFVVLCPETDPTGAYILAEKIRQGISGLSLDGQGEPIRPSVSVGVVAWPSDGATADALLVTADQAMYASKRAGKDRVTSALPTERSAEAVSGDAADAAAAARTVGDAAASAPGEGDIALEAGGPTLEAGGPALGSPIAVEADPDARGEALPGAMAGAENETTGPSAGRV